ncbi:2,4-dienoyl-CoA reductase-like NADH-dependent reductase (Old Yellow Enzyme family) [Dyadobacter sp. BE34]|uniref:2,4-dienoyl-CoA reductase-like NADH-dependent reductase (Old Yellow Enzyme family) n=1 Tax=Dyadobacter fermentans TaxID=94254 RepID=A0ABU1QWG8_9BACT|nr:MULTISPECIES: NADH:flavin oxidoreductase [Dyadobacter]MDR6805504.1 2,4-dienoyl-CoA reductase-like NADH-dependent reductase (Old Yellow Enzyme family) [Dyadobacter fermentans]MDR7042736.1 2,4-dienoyl-CoA reductase-like NADH-dependent reductase (Old Yellow Enzyme family) [Dyadobacter sp. BE242]MDR7197048.1 2,4-dienoyl-CoA reductase-like NADH-dependent reductase (Old Yellow Enzyme family) [Dyadobacter sp. BE34]MDR7215517.1 2,4-dienoyl-CoA reductase-like NADH-dependent reductase (Old Yellow Enzy
METISKTIFDSPEIHGRKLANRLVVAPMTRVSATPDGVPTQEMADYYEAFAAGGFGMIITEGTYTDELFSKANHNQPGIANTAQMQGWKCVATAVHRHNVLIINQLMHGGALSEITDETIAPSAVQPLGLRATDHTVSPSPFPMPRAMQAEDLEAVKAGYVHAAWLAYEAGFDGVELHAANGYLFDQFITPYTNLRTDAYGGNERNRLRFLMEVYRAVKAALPDGFIVGIRVSESKVNDLTYRWPGGSETARRIFEVLAEINPDYLHIAAEGGRWERECRYPDGTSSNSIAKSLLKSPVIANGGMHDVALAEKLLNSNAADLVSIGRAAIASSDWPKLMAAGQPVIPFFKELIKPSLTLAHTRRVREQCDESALC